MDRLALVEVLFERHNAVPLPEIPKVIFALEPSPENFQMAQKNTAPYSNITLIAGALWPSATTLPVANQDDCAWAYRMEETAAGETIRGWTMPELLEQNALEGIDFLKVDIMGAEEFVFAEASAWLSTTQTALVKPHSVVARRVLSDVFGAEGFLEQEHGNKLLFLRSPR